MLDKVPYVFYAAHMDYRTRNFAIECNRERLVSVVVELFAMIGLTEGAMVERVSRPVYRKVQRILRSAESARRRLIIASARDIVVEPTPQACGAGRARKLWPDQEQSRRRGQTQTQARLPLQSVRSVQTSRLGHSPPAQKAQTQQDPAPRPSPL